MSLSPATRTGLKLALVALFAACLATALYFAQAGFGGGHGRFDSLIFCLGLPASLGLFPFSVPPLFKSSDLIAIIWLPAIANMLILFAVGSLFARLRRSVTFRHTSLSRSTSTRHH
jgi:hypothetical protein